MKKQKFIANLNAVLKELGFATADADGKVELTDDQWKQVADAYKKKADSDMYEDIQAVEAEQRGTMQESAMRLIQSNAEAADGGEQEPDSDGGKATTTTTTSPAATNSDAAELKALKEEKEKLEAEKIALEGKVKKMEDKPEPEDVKTVKLNAGLNGPGTTTDHLFGINDPLFSMKKRWNRVAANPGYAHLNEVSEKNDGRVFQDEVMAYGESLAKRYRELHTKGLLATLVAMLKGEISSAALEVDYADLANAGLGKQFVVRRQDALIARIKEIPTVTHLFPKRYGVQDRELMTNAFFTEFSQAYQEGEIWKGGVELEPDMGHVDDAMFKTQFKSLKWIERQYIGYLNSDGSDPVKWNMIEWMLLRIAEVLINEQSVRNIRGHYIKPVAGTAGHYLYAGFGVIHTLIRKVHEYKLLPLDDSSYNTYDNTLTTMVDAIQYFLSAARLKLDNLNGYAIYLNEAHKMWYRAAVRRMYGKDMDFSGPKGETVVDWDVPIKWVPNMGNSTLMILQKPGNIQLVEYLPGEMLAVQFEKKMEAVNSWSMWKEGAAPAFCGREFASRTELIANDYALQQIFINKPASAFTADDATPDVSGNFWFLTVANDDETVITDLDGAKAGEVYIIEVGSTTNAPTIAKSGVFSELSTAWSPSAVGDYIKLMYDATNDKFHDLERCVGGTRAIVSTKQPNIYKATR